MEQEIFKYLLTAIGSLIAIQFFGIRKDLKEISTSVQKLNISIALVVKDQDWHKQEIRDIKERISALEQGEQK